MFIYIYIKISSSLKGDWYSQKMDSTIEPSEMIIISYIRCLKDINMIPEYPESLFSMGPFNNIWNVTVVLQ